jgi:hypothetical protein
MRIFLVAALLAVPATALADAAPDVSKMSSDDCARARKQNKTCVLTIEDEKVEGGVPSIGGEPITIIDWTKMGSLIRIRREFIVEILKSAEDI